MKTIKYMIKPQLLLLSLILSYAVSFNAQAELKKKNCKIYIAERVFDGNNLYAEEPMAVVINKQRIHQVIPAADINFKCKKELNLGDATILPGFIESHAHINFQNVKPKVVLSHGITTARDVGSALIPPSGGKGKLRHVNTGPIIQAAGGYPLSIFGNHGAEGYSAHAVVANDVGEAINHVEHIANSGAVAIKVALEVGGEEGAPWSGGHGHAAGNNNGPLPGEWPILSEEILVAIVNTAHNMGIPVIAHAGEQVGFDRAVAAGVDEFAHLPCAQISGESLFAAVAAGIRFQTTSDTLSGCHGITANMHGILHAETHLNTEATVIYASEVAHNDVPWGINAQEMINMLLNFAGHNPVNFGHVLRVLKSATSVPGALIGLQVGEPLLGTLTPGAPADIIGVKGNAIEKFKLLEYPELVVSSGKEVVNNLK